MDRQSYKNVWSKRNRQNTSIIISIEGQKSSFKMDGPFGSKSVLRTISGVKSLPTGGLEKDSSKIYTFELGSSS